MTDIRQATESDIESLCNLYEKVGKKNDVDYFEQCFEKDCIVLIASRGEDGVDGREDIGFGLLNFEPKYNLYQRLEIPEIQDLNVIPAMREQGVATALINAFENLAMDQGAEQVGVSVGLNKDYGPAQRLYAKLNYLPDGCGVTYNREYVKAGEACPVDDDLCLMMVKNVSQ